MNRPVEERVALVTGGASGIGLATVRRLARDVAVVVVADVDEQGGAAAAEEVGGLFVATDVADPSAWTRLVTRIEERYGHLDDVHLNAGVLTGEGSLTALDDEHYRRVTRINMDGVVFGLRAVVPVLHAGGGGAIVATASIAGLAPFPIDPIYTMTKHAVVGLVRSSAPQLHALGVTIDAVCPGIVDTPLVGEARDPLMEAGFPLIPPEAVAEVVVSALHDTGTGRTIACRPGHPPEAVPAPDLLDPLAEPKRTSSASGAPPAAAGA